MCGLGADTSNCSLLPIYRVYRFTVSYCTTHNLYMQSLLYRCSIAGFVDVIPPVNGQVLQLLALFLHVGCYCVGLALWKSTGVYCIVRKEDCEVLYCCVG